MLVYSDGSVMGFRERLVMVRSEDMGLVTLAYDTEAQIYHQLLGATYS